MDQDNDLVTEVTETSVVKATRGRKKKVRGEAASVETAMAFIEDKLRTSQLVMQDANNELNWNTSAIFAKAGVVARKKLNSDLVKVRRGVYMCVPRDAKKTNEILSTNNSGETNAEQN